MKNNYPIVCAASGCGVGGFHHPVWPGLGMDAPVGHGAVGPVPVDKAVQELGQLTCCSGGQSKNMPYLLDIPVSQLKRVLILYF